MLILYRIKLYDRLISIIFLFPNLQSMWAMKNHYLELSEHMTEDEMVEFWFQQSKDNDKNYYDSFEPYMS